MAKNKQQTSDAGESMDLIALAESIATDLMTVAGYPQGVECYRMQLMSKQIDGTERAEGGRNKSSAIHAILENLERSPLLKRIRELERALPKIENILRGMDECECDSDDGWWETSKGAAFGSSKLTEIRKLLTNTSAPDSNGLMDGIGAALAETDRLRNEARCPGRHEVFMALNTAMISLRDALRHERKLAVTVELSHGTETNDNL